jgi:hypothetical protein
MTAFLIRLKKPTRGNTVESVGKDSWRLRLFIKDIRFLERSDSRQDKRQRRVLPADLFVVVVVACACACADAGVVVDAG